MPENAGLLQEYSTCNKKYIASESLGPYQIQCASGKTVTLNNTGLQKTTNLLLFRCPSEQVHCRALQARTVEYKVEQVCVQLNVKLIQVLCAGADIYRFRYY